MNHLTTAAAWTCVIATVLWQRFLLPLITRYTPEFLPLFQPLPQTQPPSLPPSAANDLIILYPAPQPAAAVKPRRRRRSTSNQPA